MTNRNDKLVEETAAAQGNLNAEPGNAERVDVQPADVNYLSLIDVDKLRVEAEQEVTAKTISGQLYNLDFLTNTKAREWMENGRTYLERAIKSKAAWTDERSERVEEQTRNQIKRELIYNEAMDRKEQLLKMYEEVTGERWVKPVKTDPIDTSKNATVLCGEQTLEYLRNLNK